MSSDELPDLPSDGTFSTLALPSRGQLRRIPDPDQMWDLFEAYIASCRAANEPLTLLGACRSMGFRTTKTLHEYANIPGYLEPIEYMLGAIEEEYEKRLHGSSSSGAQFFLEAKAGWTRRAPTPAPTNPDEDVHVTADDMEMLRQIAFLINSKTIEHQQEPEED